MCLEQVALQLVLLEALLAHRAEVVRLVRLPHEQVGVGLEVAGPRPARCCWRHGARAGGGVQPARHDLGGLLGLKHAKYLLKASVMCGGCGVLAQLWSWGLKKADGAEQT